MPGTQSIPKRDLILLLNANTSYWESSRIRPGKWKTFAKTPVGPIRASATNERQAMENLCKRLGLL